MSYILDALKKAERERGIDRTPSLTGASDHQGVRRSRLFAIAGVLLCAVVALLFFLPVRTTTVLQPESSRVGADHDRPASRSAAEQVGQPTAVEKATAAPAHSDAGRNRDTGAPESSGVEPGSGSNAPPRSLPGMIPRYSAAQSPSGDARRGSRSSQGEALSQRGAGEPGTAPSLDIALPQAGQDSGSTPTKEVAPAPGDVQPKPAPLQEAIAKMTLNILVYEESEAARRVVINGRKYVKGDFVEGHYLVEDITLEGVMLSYDGVRALLRPR